MLMVAQHHELVALNSTPKMVMTANFNYIHDVVLYIFTTIEKY